jgi:hypothetical protein
MLSIGMGFMFFAIGIWIGNMRVRQYIKHDRRSDVLHVLTFFAVGLALDFLGNYVAQAPLRLAMLPLMAIPSSIALYFGFRTGRIY